MSAAPTPTDLKSALVELRASVAVEGTHKGLAGAIQEAILNILGMLLAMLEDFRAGRFVPIAPVAEAPANGAPTWGAAQSHPGECDARRGVGVEGDSREDDAAAPTLRRIARAEPGEGACQSAMRAPGVLRRRPLLRKISNCGTPSRKWRNARGVRRVFPPYGAPPRGRFFKNADWRGGIGALCLFQHENDMVMTGG